jgi:hypothetical protein
MTDERRERYAEAIGYMHGVNPAPYIDAAMAVADAEDNARTQALLDEITRLRAELEAEKEEHIATLERHVNEQAENARLRTELNRWAYEHGRELGRAVVAESTIGRVRTALEFFSDDAGWVLGSELRNALDGDQS